MDKSPGNVSNDSPLDLWRATRNSASVKQEVEPRGTSRDKSTSQRSRNAAGRRQESRGRNRAIPEASIDIDWCKYTHFRARNSVRDLERFYRLTKRRRGGKNLFAAEGPDNTGLWPIHWAAINNRSDMIEFMLKKGSRPDQACRNRLFSNGTPLHLAAMNGSLEAADVLLNQNRDGQEGSERSERERTKEGPTRTSNLLDLRDAEGQTPLMRSAAPRSKRMDTVRDLLRKNFWSLSGRPSEMALLLICHGAKWRDTEPMSGMNLMHLAIVNDYDDIVSLLLVLDKQLLDVPAHLRPHRSEPSGPTEAVSDSDAQDGFETVDLRDRTSRRWVQDSQADTGNQSSASADEPLIGGREKARQIVASELKPLQLAILYGRVAMISQLWHAIQREKCSNSSERGASLLSHPPETTSRNRLNLQKTAIQEYSLDNKQLKSVLLKATWSNREEFAKFLKAFFLKFILALDLAFLAGMWAPLHAAADDSRRPLHAIKGGIFLLSYCASMALALRVMLRNPGYLRRNSVQYIDQMSTLMQAFSQTGESSKATSATKPLIRLHSLSPESREEPIESSRIANREIAEAQPVIGTSSVQPVKSGNKATTKEEETRTEQREGMEEAQQRVARASSIEGANDQLVETGQAKQAISLQRKFDLKDTVRLLCHKCQCIRRPRSRHCNYCNHCVQDFDHHCIYLGCCIGRRNRLDFLLTLIMMSITGLYGTLLISQEFARSGWSFVWLNLAFIWVFKWVLIGLLLAFQNLRRACLGVTLYEEIRSRRLRHLFGRLGPSAEISKSHRGFSTLKGSFWRYDPDRFITGDQSSGDIMQNFKEFANYISCDEYLLSLACADTPVARAIASNDSRINATYKLL